MSNRVAFPFHRLDDKAVNFKGWLIGDTAQPLFPANEILEGWDYDRQLEVCAHFEFNFEWASHLLDIPMDDLSLAIILKAGTGTGKRARRVEQLCVEKINSSISNITLQASVPSEKLSGRLLLEASVVLESIPKTLCQLSPVLPGSKLWSCHKDILLEDGGSARFPIELISFSKAFSGQEHSNAPWYVHWRTGRLDADFGGSVRVYVNSDHTEISNRFVMGDPPTVQAILGDVISQMIEHVLLHNDYEDNLEEYCEGSIGEQVSHWLNMAFPGQTINKIRAGLESAPGRFRASILSVAQVRVPE